MGFRFYPHLTKSEGFFCAALRKISDENQAPKNKSKKNKLETANKNEVDILSQYVVKTENNAIIKFKKDFKLLNSGLLSFFEIYGQEFYFKKLGTVLGELKQNNFIPDHELAQSNFINREVNKIELSYEQALMYLKKENLKPETLSKSLEKGLVLMTYKNYGLGWAKILDNRINNYLPKNYRILGVED